ncbi:PD-(D/E)XK nuclease family protein [Schumannella sp. 10F1B-5-1]|uniref:PD-(D/E)XK nuclease family protein n=1 Tax=Schumannella sp. 10F1B-5-1 TaxID=2590780 RepID=UPI0015E867FA|nr:PD-(D/E)XK nuclease family protein [Schumannella sp. 10F1B-5-1]
MHPDPSQLAVLDLAPGASAVVVGAPGSGRTSTLIELVARRVEADGFAPDEVIALAAGRASATRLRDRLAERLRAVPDAPVSSGPLARTIPSLAFDAVVARAAAEGAPRPRLLSGPEQDLLIAELLHGAIDDGGGADWPPHLSPAVRRLPVFRTELRELLMRLTEYDIPTRRLRAAGGIAGRPEWVAAAEFAEEYRAVVSAVGGSSLDPAELMAYADAAVRAGHTGERLARARLVVVDDLQQATEGAMRLLAAIAARGVPIVAFGDPDVATESFRGGEADALAAFPERMGVPVVSLRLQQVHRQSPALRALTTEVTGRIGAAGAGTQRAAAASGDDDPAALSAIAAATPAAEHRAIARVLRERHLLDGVPWSQLAVVVRSGAAIPALSRALALAQVPTRSTAGSRALRDDPAAAALLELVSVGTGRLALDGLVAERILTGPFGGLDPVALRRLRVALRAEELAGGGTRLGAALLAEALDDEHGFATIDHQVGRRAARTARLLARLRAESARGASAEELLWTAWERSGVADDWRTTALGTGIAAEETNRALDGVVALFAAARRFVEREPEREAEAFLASVLDADIPEDTLAPRTSGEAVLVTTPSGAVGIEVDTVVVAGLQDGQWPNLRPRGSLLRAGELGDAIARLDAFGQVGGASSAATEPAPSSAATAVPAAGVIDERRAVLADELRMFALAVSRASRRVVLAAVAGDDEVPSPFHGFARRVAGDALVEPDGDAVPLDLRGMTGRLRRALTQPGAAPEQRRSAAGALARLAAAEVPGADPATWHGLLAASTDAPLHDLGDPEVRVPVSPSALGTLERSAMEWFVERMAGSSSSLSANIGSLVHHALEHAVDADPEHLWQLVESRWGELTFDSPWAEEVERRRARTAVTALASYLRTVEAEGVVLVSAEGSFRLDVAPAVVNGKIDRVESHGGRIVIVDLKTGSVVSAREAESHPQMSAYQLAYDGGVLDGLPEGNSAGGARLLFTKKGVAGKPYTLRDQAPLAPEQLEEFRGTLRAAAVTIAGPAYPATLIDDPFEHGGALRAVHLPGEVTGD